MKGRRAAPAESGGYADLASDVDDAVELPDEPEPLDADEPLDVLLVPDDESEDESEDEEPEEALDGLLALLDDERLSVL